MCEILSPLSPPQLLMCMYVCICSEEKDWKLLEDLLAGLCTFFRVAASNGRSRLCSLGKLGRTLAERVVDMGDQEKQSVVHN